jgi:hypothetical protein
MRIVNARMSRNTVDNIVRPTIQHRFFSLQMKFKFLIKAFQIWIHISNNIVKIDELVERVALPFLVIEIYFHHLVQFA